VIDQARRCGPIDRHDEGIAGDRRHVSEESMVMLSETMHTGDHAAIKTRK
jgi:putative transposase